MPTHCPEGLPTNGKHNPAAITWRPTGKPHHIPGQSTQHTGTTSTGGHQCLSTFLTPVVDFLYTTRITN
jgi:hypothetical protein